MGCASSRAEPWDGLLSEDDPQVRSYETQIEETTQKYEVEELAPLRDKMMKLAESFKQSLADATTDKRLTRNQAALNSSRHDVNGARSQLDDLKQQYASVQRHMREDINALRAEQRDYIARREACTSSSSSSSSSSSAVTPSHV